MTIHSANYNFTFKEHDFLSYHFYFFRQCIHQRNKQYWTERGTLCSSSPTSNLAPFPASLLDIVGVSLHMSCINLAYNSFNHIYPRKTPKVLPKKDCQMLIQGRRIPCLRFSDFIHIFCFKSFVASVLVRAGIKLKWSSLTCASQEFYPFSVHAFPCVSFFLH